MNDPSTIYLSPYCSTCDVFVDTGMRDEQLWCQDDMWSGECDECGTKVVSPRYTRVGDGWRDISTARRDRQILVAEIEAGRVLWACTARWDPSEGRLVCPGGVLKPPTHWMPVPPA